MSRSGVDDPHIYVCSHEQHHRRFDLKTEYVSLLEKNAVEYDPQYLWD